jgi:hypothetical protein
MRAGDLGSAFSRLQPVSAGSRSWRRELTPSFTNTFRRWYSTVRALMYSSSPISGLVRPSADLSAGAAV